MSLERLAIAQAHLTSEKKRLLELRKMELSNCYLTEFKVTGRSDHADFINDISDSVGGNFDQFYCCSEVAYFLFKDEMNDFGRANYEEHIEMIGCPHCIQARELKHKTNAISTKLGQIRGQITMAGNRLIGEVISA
tara:strand:- start:40 stop:447 length:408 start_codon:yes stop_codon:yes gene_type:complete